MAPILVIDDDSEQRTLLRRMLMAAGYEVREANEGREGVTLCQARPVALVLIDLVMPGTDGFDTIPALRALVPAPKILAISGWRIRASWHGRGGSARMASCRSPWHGWSS
jgi:CheY-like chemotaxis protein